MEREKVTPKKAEQWLNKNSLNRKLRPGWVEKMADDMRNNKWTQCIVPIAFYEDGNIADGQHRLWAIVESQTAQQFYVLRDLPRAAGFNIDTGGARTLIDNARIAGVNEELTNEALALARAIDTGDKFGGTKISNSEKYEQYSRHRDVIDWVLRHGVRKGQFLKNAITNGAIARAWYVEKDKERLTMFGHVVATGLANGMEDSAAVTLRNFLLATRTATGASATWRDAFMKAQNAIWYFMRKRKLLLLKTQTGERYPLPDGKTKW